MGFVDRWFFGCSLLLYGNLLLTFFGLFLVLDAVFGFPRRHSSVSDRLGLFKYGPLLWCRPSSVPFLCVCFSLRNIGFCAGHMRVVGFRCFWCVLWLGFSVFLAARGVAISNFVLFFLAWSGSALRLSSWLRAVFSRLPL